jgi:hypothetical protein
MKKLIFTIFLALMSTTMLAQIDVTFQCDMGAQVFKGNFDPGAADFLVVRGSFQIDAGDTANWYGEMFTLDDGDADTVYTLTVQLPTDSAGKVYEFKFVTMPGDGWEADNRSFTLTAPGPQVLEKVWYNNDSSYSLIVHVTNTLNFTADISGILGIGAGGAFGGDDSLQVMGLDWDNLGTDVMGNRTMVEDPFNPGIYTTSMTVTSGSATVGEGDSTKWKYKAWPGDRFSGDGWESGSDRWHIYQADGSVIDLPVIVPRILPLFDTLANDINVTFNVDMSDPVNQYNNLHIDPTTLEFVGMRGGADFLGNWSSGGNWLPSDTTSGFMKVLTDMGNNIWSRTAFIPGGTQAGGFFEYKFAMMYPGADTVNGGSSPLDNEGGFGTNHNFVLFEGPDIILNNVFGDFITSVERLDDLTPSQFELEQNYPNPFNPSTKIRFTIPEAGLVTLKIYNLLGEEVATLLNEEQTTGVYEVTFDAARLSSGVYFYTMTSGNFVASKKMILLK